MLLKERPQLLKSNCLLVAVPVTVGILEPADPTLMLTIEYALAFRTFGSSAKHVSRAVQAAEDGLLGIIVPPGEPPRYSSLDALARAGLEGLEEPGDRVVEEL
ncbi:hypothetical protein ACWCPI_17030 [Streptomyces sp. NPDC001920]